MANRSVACDPKCGTGATKLKRAHGSWAPCQWTLGNNDVGWKEMKKAVNNKGNCADLTKLLHAYVWSLCRCCCYHVRVLQPFLRYHNR